MRALLVGAAGICGALAMTFLAGCQTRDEFIRVDPNGSKPVFAGVQKDYWCAVAPDRLKITSELTLQTRPARAVVMPIRSPARHAQLEAVAVASRRLDFHKTGRGVYEVNLPSDKQLARQRLIVFQWQLPLNGLRYEYGLYWTYPRSLVPVLSYELQAGAEPQSGFEVFGALPGNKPAAYSWDFSVPTSEFGRECALPIRAHEQ